MKVIGKVVDTYKSTHTDCARNIGSGNIFANKTHLHVLKLPAVQTISNIVASGDTESTKAYESEFEYGEVVSVAGGATDTRKVTITGEDFFGHPMTEEITLNNTTYVSGKKAFKRILKVVAASAGAVDMKTTNKIGLPYQTAKLDLAIVNGATSATPSLTGFTHTQTATSNDPRGTVDLSGLSAGDEVELILVVTEFCSKTNGVDTKGGLFGCKPYQA